ncbi:hypothetical protein FOA52_009439 [Chlamydomonas sp. UWO 241]|nr:hypothetical protein FOA52_009439 [Chlamydomonas sp. UWO 241]
MIMTSRSTRGPETPCLLLSAKIFPGIDSRACDVVCILDTATARLAAADLDVVEKECGTKPDRPEMGDLCAKPVSSQQFCSSSPSSATASPSTLPFLRSCSPDPRRLRPLFDAPATAAPTSMKKSFDIGKGMPLVLLLATMALLAAGGAQAGRGRGSETPCLLLDAEVCPGNHTLTCANAMGDVVCIHSNATACPAPADLDSVEKECGMHARPHACALPADATECPGNHTLSCKNTAGDVICVDDKNVTECPAASDLDDVKRECRGPPPAHMHACALPADATVCPSPANYTLSCVNTAGDIICVDDKDATACPAAADLDEVHKECRGPPPAHTQACALPADAIVCPGPANHTLSCKNTASDVICVDDKNATECPAAADLDDVERECGNSTKTDRPEKPDGGRATTIAEHVRGGPRNRRMLLA